MSSVIWGTPLQTSYVLDDYANVFETVDVSDLNDWTVKTIIRHPEYVDGYWSFHSDYDESTKNNVCTIVCKGSNWESVVHPISVKAGQILMFSLEYQGPGYELLENKTGDGQGDGIAMAIAESEDATTWFLANTANAFRYLPKEEVSKFTTYSIHQYFSEDTTVYLHIGFADVHDDIEYQFNIRNIKCQLIPGNKPISYAQKPFNLNILDGNIWNFIAVQPGAWFYSIYDDHRRHHVYCLSGNEFKLLEFQDADGNGTIPHKEYRSTPIVIKGERYHSLYLSRTVDSVCPFPTQYYKLDEMPSDEDIYSELIPYVREADPYERGDVLGLWALRNLLSANSGDANVDIDDLKAMLKSYIVDEYQNPYLDNPTTENPGE